MARGPSAAPFKHLQTLFQLGLTGGLTDGQLLDRFVQWRDQSAFAALVERHGPMVLRACRSRLGDHHDAEDAFQATFLVLAQKASSIRKPEALAGWLLGVAGRVSLKARHAARRRSVVEQQAGPSSDNQPKPDRAEAWAELFDELERLPERYRLPLVFCYLEGMTYEQAAERLSCPVRTVQTRLARGRARLRDRLSRHGLSPAAVFSNSGTLTDSHALVLPVTLVDSTVEAAQRFATVKGAAAGLPAAAVMLSKEVLHAMLLSKLNVVARIVLFIGVIATGAWIAWPLDESPTPRPAPAPVAAVVSPRRPLPGDRASAEKKDEAHFMTGFLRVEKTREPVAGARVRVSAGSNDLGGAIREAQSDGDGRYSIALPEGNAQVFSVTLPPGYYLPAPGNVVENFALTSGQPVVRKDYEVRRGAVWRFRLTRGEKQELVKAGAIWQSPVNRPETDAQGLAELTLPDEAGNTILKVWANVKNEPMLDVDVRWDEAFRPDAVVNVRHLEQRGQPARFQVTDDGGRSATISGPVDVAAPLGRLICSVSLPDPAGRATGTLTGSVVDDNGRSVANASVTIFYAFREGRGTMSDRDIHRVKTDAQGRYVIPSIPRLSHEGDPTRLVVVVYKDGFAGFDSPEFVFRPGSDGAQGADPIQLRPGLTVSGTIVDPDGRPVAGALIRAGTGWATAARTFRSGADGRFQIPGLTKGVVPMSFTFGKLIAAGKYVVDGQGDLNVQLRPGPAADRAAVAPRPEPPPPINVGEPAPEWHVRGWTDGKPRSLADYRGKVVFLGFWGIWCGPSVKSLALVEGLRAKYESQGVVFVKIHTVGDTLDNIRKLLDLEPISSVSALDQGNDNDIMGGTTVRAYGVRGFPTAILIDRIGKIAFRSDDAAGQPALEALSRDLGKKLGLDMDSTLTAPQSRQLSEAVLGNVIEKILARH